MEMGSRKEFILRAETTEQREEWVSLLQANADRTPVQKKMMEKINNLKIASEVRASERSEPPHRVSQHPVRPRRPQGG
jgi:hypothetical protein